MYPIVLSQYAVRDLAKLRRESPKYAAKFLDLLLDILQNPFSGLGEPEPLKGICAAGGPGESPKNIV